MRPKILVTGGGGLLGHALKDICPEAVFVTSRDADLTELRDVRRLFEAVKPEQVIHLAAKVGGVKKNAGSNADLFTANAQINTNVLSVAKEYRVSRLISVLSSCAFNFYPDRASTEDDLHAGMPFGGNLGYGYSKRMIDIQTRLLWEQNGCRFSSVTPVTMYGPNDNWDLEDGHVLGALIHKCHLAKQQNRNLEVWGSGDAIRQFVYSYDVARLLLKALEVFSGYETVIIAADRGITMRDLAKAVAKTMGFKGEIVFDKSRPEGQLLRVVESRLFKDRLGDFKFTPFEQGLRETTAWFSENIYLAVNGAV